MEQAVAMVRLATRKPRYHVTCFPSVQKIAAISDDTVCLNECLLPESYFEQKFVKKVCKRLDSSHGTLTVGEGKG